MTPKSRRPLPSWRGLASTLFRGRAHQDGIAERKAMIDRGHDRPITKQVEVEVLRISRGSVYCRLRPVPEAALRSCVVSTSCISSFPSPVADVAWPVGG